MQRYLRCYAKVDLRAIEHNITEVKKRIPADVKVLAVVKADAYGHGAAAVAKYLEKTVDYFAVATLDEALELRRHAITLPILILGYVSSAQYEGLLEADAAAPIYRYEDAVKLSETAGRLSKVGCIHIAVDTGMNRIGFQVEELQADEAAKIARLPNLKIEGIFTHLSCADQFDQTYTEKQLALFDKMDEMLTQRGMQIPIRHVCNSAAVMELDHHRLNMVRSGIVTYGLYPSEEVHKEAMELWPALEWKAHVIHVKKVPAGRGVSYGATYVTERETTIATISAGYADGYPRALSGKGRVLIHGIYAPILGRVCMDQFMVDVSHIPDVQIEDEVTLIGRDGENRITAEEVGNLAGSFNYEQICRIDGRRVPRIYE